MNKTRWGLLVLLFALVALVLYTPHDSAVATAVAPAIDEQAAQPADTPVILTGIGTDATISASVVIPTQFNNASADPILKGGRDKFANELAGCRAHYSANMLKDMSPAIFPKGGGDAVASELATGGVYSYITGTQTAWV